MNREILSVRKWARQRGYCMRRVYELLYEGRIAGASKNERGEWEIAADAQILPSQRNRQVTAEAKG